MKIIRWVLIFLLIQSSLFASQKMSLQELISIASTYVKFPIILDRSLENDLFIYTQTPLTKLTINEILLEVLKMNNLKLVKNKNFYILKEVVKEDSRQRILKINYLNESQIKVVMNYLKVEYVYLDSKILFTVLKNKNIEIEKIFKSVDAPPIQKKMKITIMETNLNKLKELGLKYNLTDISKNIFNMSLGNLVATINPNQIKSFGLDLKALQNDGITKIISHPILTIRDMKKTVFNLTQTIPVKTSSISIENSDIKSTENINYNSYGIKVDVIAKMLKSRTDLKLSIKLEDIISITDDKPTTSDKTIIQNVMIEDNNVYMLTGFKKTLKVTNDEGLPILKDIPLLGYFFKWSSDKDIEILLQIIIEIEKNDKNYDAVLFEPAKKNAA